MSLVAHYNVVVDVIRRIEKSKKGLFLVKGARVKRYAEEFGGPRLGGMGGPEAPGGAESSDRRSRFVNAPAHEAPVEVELNVSLFEFPPEEGQS